MTGDSGGKGWVLVLVSGTGMGVAAWLSGDGGGSTVPAWVLPAVAVVVVAVAVVVWLLVRSRG